MSITGVSSFSAFLISMDCLIILVGQALLQLPHLAQTILNLSSGKDAGGRIGTGTETGTKREISKPDAKPESPAMNTLRLTATILLAPI